VSRGRCRGLHRLRLIFIVPDVNFYKNIKCFTQNIRIISYKRLNKKLEVMLLQDDELIQKLLNGEQDAFSYMIDAYSKLLWVVVGGILNTVGTAQDIEECISDVYIQVWKNPNAFNQQKGSLKTFLAVIAKSKALDAYRRLSKTKIVELDEAIQSTDNDLLDYIVDKEMCHALYTAIESLTEPNKEIVMRRYILEERPASIAKSVSMPVKEVENRLYQSKLKLRKKLEGQGGFELCPINV
jgi:RNA polymerase sigma-70 factor (ECF subfamily)